MAPEETVEIIKESYKGSQAKRKNMSRKQGEATRSAHINVIL